RFAGRRCRGCTGPCPAGAPPRLARPGHLQDKDLCILCNVALQTDLKTRAEALRADFVAQLTQVVRAGHGLPIFARDHVVPEAYNRVLGDEHGLLPLRIEGLLNISAKEPLRIDRNSIALPALSKFKEDEFYKGFGNIEIFRALDLGSPFSRSPAADAD